MEQLVQQGINPIAVAAERLKIDSDIALLEQQAKKLRVPEHTATAYIDLYRETRDQPDLFIPYFCRPHLVEVLAEEIGHIPPATACTSRPRPTAGSPKKKKKRKTAMVSRRPN
ncbi:MAG TPA: hypothetical protein VHO23_00365 [Candidatus Paceibacterota bacterium]|nr:hypothetical protein [Candidatus Paceibacterota bacterium]